MSVGDVIIASSPAPLCDGESHKIQVTISGNQTLLLVDGKTGRSEDSEIPTDVLSQSSTFIGGLPGEDTHCIHVQQDVFMQYEVGLRRYCNSILRFIVIFFNGYDCFSFYLSMFQLYVSDSDVFFLYYLY